MRNVVKDGDKDEDEDSVNNNDWTMRRTRTRMRMSMKMTCLVLLGPYEQDAHCLFLKTNTCSSFSPNLRISAFLFV